MIIPPEKLDPSTLDSLLESFITREGTDYGSEELTLQQKLENLKSQLTSGGVVISYDELSESLNLVPKDQHRAKT